MMGLFFMPQIVHCCECEYNNHCITQEFVEDASKIPFDKNTWFCADAKAAPTFIPTEGVYGQYTDTAGNYHWFGTRSGEHIIKVKD